MCVGGESESTNVSVINTIDLYPQHQIERGRSKAGKRVHGEGTLRKRFYESITKVLLLYIAIKCKCITFFKLNQCQKLISVWGGL